MWVINLIPDWVVHLLLFVGIGGIIVASILRSILLYPIAALIFCASVFLEGLIFGQKDMREQIAILEAKAQQYQQESTDLNKMLADKHDKKIIQIKEKTNEIVKYVDQYVTKYDNDCRVPNAFVLLHDSAAKAVVPDSPSESYEGTSEVKISDVGRTVTENYGIYHEVVEQTKAWQEWYTEQKKLFDKIYNNEKD
jgi:cell division protein FtsB